MIALLFVPLTCAANKDHPIKKATALMQKATEGVQFTVPPQKDISQSQGEEQCLDEKTATPWDAKLLNSQKAQPASQWTPVRIPRAAGQRPAPALTETAQLIEFNTSMQDDSRGCAGTVTFVPLGNDSMTVYNLWNYVDTLQGHYDATQGTVSIYPGLIYTHPTYGEIWIVPIKTDSQGRLYYTTKSPITGTVDDDGNVTLDAWAVLVTSGDYAGNGFAFYSKSEILQPNAQMSSVVYYKKNRKDSTITYPLYIEQPYDNQIKIYNFANNTSGTPVNGDLYGDSTCVFLPQVIFTNTLYGPFCNYPAQWVKNTTAADGVMTSKVEKGIIRLTDWGVFAKASKSMRSSGAWSSEITFEDGLFTVPETKRLDWSGDGTESSPYLITTAEEWAAFAESVTLGTNYKDKFVALGNDIDLSTLTESQRCVGNDSMVFSGTFDGQSHKISSVNLNIGEVENCGLFAFIDSAATVKNLTLENPSVLCYGTNVGAVAGTVQGKLSNITVTGGSVRYAEKVGGIVGYYYGISLDNLSFTGSVIGYGGVGGIVGVGFGDASNLQSHGSVQFRAYLTSIWSSVGGLIGEYMSGSNSSTLSDSYNDAIVTSDYSDGTVGGAVGVAVGATVERCFNAGPVSAQGTNPSTTNASVYACIGGFMGRAFGATITDCYNSSSVVNSYQTDRVGGFVGSVSTPIKVSTSQPDGTWLVTWRNVPHFKRCYNSGQVILPDPTPSQGFYGVTYEDSVFTSCYYDKQVTAVTPADSSTVTGLLTNNMGSSTYLSGFSTDIWSFSTGHYPVLKNFASTEASQLSAAPAIFKSDESTALVKTTFSISTDNGVTWQLFDGSSYTDETDALKINGNQVQVKANSDEQILVARSKSNSTFKLYSLTTFNVSNFAGTGTKIDPYLIKTKADVMRLDSCVRVYGMTFVGNYFSMTNDIDMASDTTFKGIGYGGSKYIKFSGDFNGNGHSIKNLEISKYTLDEEGEVTKNNADYGVGFFGVTGPEANIHNLTIASGHITGLGMVGAVVGYNQGTISSCKNYADVTCLNYDVGGITGYNSEDGEIEYCFNAGHIVTGSNTGGGIVGTSTGDVVYCQNVGLVEGKYVSNYHTGDLEYKVAGIAGFGNIGSISGCVNGGTVTGARMVAGIVADSGPYLSIIKNLNYGELFYTKGDGTIGAIIGDDVQETNVIEGNVFDSQLGYYGSCYATNIPGTTGLLTRELTSGNKIDSLNVSHFDFEAGLYPVLDEFVDETPVKANRKMVVTFADYDSPDDFNDPAALAQASDLSWKVLKGEYFTIDGSSLNVSLPEDETSYRDTLVATVGDYTKVIPLRSLPNAFEGSGTKEDPFLIRTTDDMEKLAKLTNDEQFPFKGRYFKVMNDLDFANLEYHVVAVDGANFQADFDGNGKKFSNVANTMAKTTQESIGLFGKVGDVARIHDLTLESGTLKGYRYVAGFAGQLYGTIDHCESHALISTTRNMGAAGIAAVVNKGGKLSNCTSYSTFSVGGNSNGGVAFRIMPGGIVDSCYNYSDLQFTSRTTTGGIVAELRGTVSNCINYGNINSKSIIGGIAAKSTNGSKILNCVNYGDVSATTGNYVGGIIGQNAKSTTPFVMTHCTNYGNITGRGSLGGIAGYLYPGCKISYCYNFGPVTSSKSIYVGGVFGQQNDDDDYIDSISYCGNFAPVVGNANRVGGFGGEVDGVYTHCFNAGEVTSTGNFVAGFAGDFDGEAYYCFNLGNVTSEGYGIGGFAGVGIAWIYGCANFGDVTSTSSSTTNPNAGGLWGYGRFWANSCYNMGTISGNYDVGGLVGRFFDGAGFTYCYNAGKVICTDESSAGHITGTSKQSDDVLNLDHCYFDNEVNTFGANEFESDAIDYTTSELSQAFLGKKFDHNPGMLPTLKELADNQLANYFATTVVLDEDNTYDHVTKPFTIGTPEGTEWALSDSVMQEGNTVNIVEPGWVTLTKSITVDTALVATMVDSPALLDSVTFTPFTLSKTYRLYGATATGLNGISKDGGNILRSVYYGTDGTLIGEVKPTQEGVYIVTEYYTDGTHRSKKVVVNRK
jgi:hypothetical protein